MSNLTLEKIINETWKRLVAERGKTDAERFMREVMGQKITKAGRPRHNDELSRRIKLFLAATHHGGGKISRKAIVDALTSSGLRRLKYRDTVGPNAHAYIDPDTGEEEFDPDMEVAVDHVSVNKSRTLDKKFDRIRDRLIARGELPKSAKRNWQR